MSRSKPPILATTNESLPEELTYQAKLRQAVFDGINEADVTEVVKGIVNQAKAGDDKAQKLMFEYFLGARNPVKVVMHNHFENVEQAAKLSRRMGLPKAEAKED